MKNLTAVQLLNYRYFTRRSVKPGKVPPNAELARGLIVDGYMNGHPRTKVIHAIAETTGVSLNAASSYFTGGCRQLAIKF